MRTVGGRNLLGMKTEEVIQISRTLEKAGITVPTFVSPLFKWKAPGKSTAAAARSISPSIPSNARSRIGWPTPCRSP